VLPAGGYRKLAILPWLNSKRPAASGVLSGDLDVEARLRSALRGKRLMAGNKNPAESKRGWGSRQQIGRRLAFGLGGNNWNLQNVQFTNLARGA